MRHSKTHFGYQSIPVDEKVGRVRGVFDSVAAQYDLMNDLMSLGLHRLWKKIAVSRLQVEPHHRVLDLAGGTADLTQRIVPKLNPEKGGQVILADINEAMLTVGKTRLYNQGFVEPVSLVELNGEKLPFQDAFFDRIICGFGLRNMTHIERALSEMARTLKPGGKAVILEFSTVPPSLLKKAYEIYSFKLLPKLGQWIAGDAKSYQYLAESIRMHPNQETLKNKMLMAGFDNVTVQNLHQGIVALHSGYTV